MSRILVGVVAAALLAACSSTPTGPATITEGDWEVLFDAGSERISEFTAAPDGAFFATSQASLYRAPSDNPAAWQRVDTVPDHLFRISAVSGDDIFALGTRRNVIYRWNAIEGWTEIDYLGALPEGRTFTGGLLSVWARGTGEVFGVGDDPTTVVHLAGGQAKFIDVPSGAKILWTIHGDDQSLYIAATTTLFELRDGAWSLHTIQGPEATTCGMTAVLKRADRAYTVGREQACLFTLFGGELVSLSSAVGQLEGLFQDGVLSRDGLASFWTRRGGVVVIGDRIKAFSLPRRSLAGAVAQDDHLYFAIAKSQELTTGSVIARVIR